MNNEFIYPDFNNSLVNVPHSVLAHFNLPHSKPELKTPLLQQIKDCSKLILFLVDGFGYNLFKKEAIKYPFFRKIADEKLITHITTIFPSTTAACITTINSGLTPKEHGLPEWNIYFQEVDAIVQPLPYKFIPTPYHTNNISLPKDSKMLFNNITVYELLKNGNIPSFYFIPKELKDSVYTKMVSKGATLIQYVSITDLFLELSKILQKTKGKAFFYVYWETIDTQEHVYGPRTKNVNAEIELFDYMIQKFINNLDNKTCKDTAILITADHGQYPIKPEKTIYLNNFGEISKNFKRSRNGIPIPPSGNPRDIFLHIADNKIDETLITLKNLFGNIADIIKLDHEMIERLFGKEKEHPEFANRLGNILILPKGGKSIWYEYTPGKKVEYYGHHGGLTPDEMYIPFIASKIDRLL